MAVGAERGGRRCSCRRAHAGVGGRMDGGSLGWLTAGSGRDRFLPVKYAAGSFLCALAFLALASCSSVQHVVLNADGSGTASIHVSLDPLVVRYLSDLLAATGGQGSAQQPLFDLTRIESDFAQLPGVTLVSASSPTRSTLDLDVAFTQVGEIVPASPVSPILFSSDGGLKRVSVHLSAQTVPSLLALAPLADDPVLSSLGPRPDHPYTEAQYLELLDYAFSDYAPAADIKRVAESAMLAIRVDVKGTLVSQSGGKLDGSTAVFSIPLLSLVTLEKPIDLAITYR
jgi:hypothetical protein